MAVTDIATAAEKTIGAEVAHLLQKTYAEAGRAGPVLACRMFARIVAPATSEAYTGNAKLRALAANIIDRTADKPEADVPRQLVQAWLERAKLADLVEQEGRP